jgi:hypothetical protein
MRAFGILSFIIGLGLSGAWAQEAEVPPVTFQRIAQQGAMAQAFVPQGWTLETELKGDLDKDRREDLALVLHMADPANILKKFEDMEATYDTNPRMLAVALAQPEGGYRLVLEDHTFIPRLENSSQSDPLSETGGVAFENGSLKITLYLFMSAGGWDAGNTSYRFRMEKEKLRLIGYDSYNVHRGSGDISEVSINLLTGRVEVGTGNISEDETKTEVKKLKDKPVLTIADLGVAGERFTPQY